MKKHGIFRMILVMSLFGAMISACGPSAGNVVPTDTAPANTAAPADTTEPVI
jgi:hypothetical protein